jgi:hypothetical protein
MINKKIVERGLAHVYIVGGSDEHTKDLENAELIAIELGLGIWEKSSDICVRDGCIILEDFNNGKSSNDTLDCQAGEEYIILRNNCRIDCNFNGWTIKDEATHIYHFNNIILRGQDTLTLFNGKGEDRGNRLFFQNPEKCASLWNDDHDTMFLRDGEGKLVWFYEY